MKKKKEWQENRGWSDFLKENMFVPSVSKKIVINRKDNSDQNITFSKVFLYLSFQIKLMAKS